MAKRKIIWTEKANWERKDILDYWIFRNQSKTFSIKLNKLIIENLNLLATNPDLGKKTNLDNIRVQIVRDYLLFYEILDNEILVLSLWDSRRDHKNIKLK